MALRQGHGRAHSGDALSVPFPPLPAASSRALSARPCRTVYPRSGRGLRTEVNGFFGAKREGLDQSCTKSSRPGLDGVQGWQSPGHWLGACAAGASSRAGWTGLERGTKTRTKHRQSRWILRVAEMANRPRSRPLATGRNRSRRLTGRNRARPTSRNWSAASSTPCGWARSTSPVSWQLASRSDSSPAHQTSCLFEVNVADRTLTLLPCAAREIPRKPVLRDKPP